MRERFLPIGSVVLLKGAKKALMVTSYCIFPTGTQIEKDGTEVEAEKKIYEYGGCTYPEGIVESNTVHAFNHADIEKILHIGYETDEYKEFTQILNGGYEIYKNKYEGKTTEE